MTTALRIASFLFIGIAIAYFERVGISHAMEALSAEFKLTVGQEGALFSAFSLGYVAFMLPSGYLVSRFGVGRMFYLSVLASSVLAFTQSLAVSFTSLVLIRFMMGVTEASLFPACATLIKGAIMPGRRLGAAAFFDSGSYVGAALTGPLMAWLVSTNGWRMAFAAQLLFVASWLVLWFAFRSSCSRSLLEGNPEDGVRAFREVVRSRYVWMASVGFFLYNYSKAFFLTWLPLMLLRQKGYEFVTLGFFSAIPFLLAFAVENLVANFADRMVRREPRRFGTSRRAIFFGGFSLASLVGLLPFTSGLVIDVTLVSLAFSGLIATSGAIWSLPADFCRTESSTAIFAAVQNTISNCGGIAGPLLIAFLVSPDGDYSLAVLSVAIASLMAMFIYAILLPAPKFEALPM